MFITTLPLQVKDAKGYPTMENFRANNNQALLLMVVTRMDTLKSKIRWETGTHSAYCAALKLRNES